MLKQIWMYKKNQEPKIILLENLKAEIDKGWSEWPVFSPEDFGYTAGANLDEVGDIVKVVQTSLNQSINLDTLDEFELRAYARDGLDLNVDAFEEVEELRQRIKAA